jgi:hypothetical protein
VCIGRPLGSERGPDGDGVVKKIGSDVEKDCLDPLSWAFTSSDEKVEKGGVVWTQAGYCVAKGGGEGVVGIVNLVCKVGEVGGEVVA